VARLEKVEATGDGVAKVSRRARLRDFNMDEVGVKVIENHMILASPHVLGQAASGIQVNFAAGLVQLTVNIRTARRGRRGLIRGEEQGLLIGRALLGA
jgi:hypothetical protein